MLRKTPTVLVIVAALGYFVDIYDLILFGIVRNPSLTELGYKGQALLDKGVLLLNLQMAGMLVGGILWGIWGDKRGRISVLFGSIFLYSVANIGNGFVQELYAYAILRFIAGVGLAGELGAGITLVAETFSKEKRGYGTMLVATFGAMGAVLGALVADLFDWRTAYFTGGGLGLLLLLLRMGTFESGMYERIKDVQVVKGSFFSLFTSGERFLKYLNCIIIGVPVWYVVGILIVFSPEFSDALGVRGKVEAGTAIMFAYIGLTVGDFLSGLLSQLFKSRKKIVFGFLCCSLAITLIYLFSSGISSDVFYALCFALGVASGYWAVFVTIASEQFGTNIRSTVTTSVPNFVRGSVVPLTSVFHVLIASVGMVYSALIVGMVCIGLSFISLFLLKETYGKDLNYTEVL